jgi:hypothetical protein
MAHATTLQRRVIASLAFSCKAQGPEVWLLSCVPCGYETCLYVHMGVEALEVRVSHRLRGEPLLRMEARADRELGGKRKKGVGMNVAPAVTRKMRR